MTIGRPNGNAWIGKPLDLVIPLELDRSESGDSLCLEADVVQGDVRIDDKRVTVSLDPGPNPDTPRVRLRTTRAIEEPVVTVRLSAGCAMKSTRQYVLLADLPEAPPVVAAAPPVRSASPRDAQSGDIASVPQIAPVPQPPPRTARVARGDARRAAASSGGAASGSAAPPPRRRVAPVPVQRPQRSAAAQATQKPQPPAPRTEAAVATPAEPKEGRPRLKVEPLAPESVREPPSKPSAALSGSGAGDATKLAQAPASGGQPQPEPPPQPQPQPQPLAPAQPAAPALGSAPPSEQSQRDAERLKELESALASLREQSAQTQRLLLEMRGEIAQARASRYRNPLVYGLLALLALALIALAMLWRAARRARVQLWWSGEEEEGPPVKTALPRRGELADEEDEDDDEVSAPADLTGLRAAHGLRVTALPAGVGASAFERAQVRPVNTEELYDVQQQAEFFLSLGQQEQAVGVLREHIAAKPGTSALAYLDLLAIFHSLGRRDDYASLAREFEQEFNAEVPAFEGFGGEGRGLEHYQDVLARIASAWPSQGTLDLIEELVFRRPGSSDELFDLAAYQELLLLHAVAHDVNEHEGPWAAPVPAPPPLAPSRTLSVPDDDLHAETAPMPYLPAEEGAAASESARAREMPPLELDLADLDRTAFETLRAPIEAPAARPAPAPSTDPHVIDFDPFDPGSEADLRPRHLGVKR